MNRAEQLASILSRRLRLPFDSLEFNRLEEYGRDLGELADSLPRYQDNAAITYGERLSSSPQGTGTGTGTREEAATDGWHDLNIGQVAQKLHTGDVSVSELVRHMLDRIERYEPQIRAHVTVSPSTAMEQAQALDQELTGSSWRGPLHGIPIGVKDSIPVAGIRWTANSRLYENRVATRDASAVANLRSAGAVFLGKHNLNEFGWSIPAEDDLTPPPRNPWQPGEYSVGSSSGSGAAVSARLAFGAVCTDGGGSARLPAGQHGLFAIKPTHDNVPRDGYTDRTLSEISFLARSAPDAAMLFAAARVGQQGTASLPSLLTRVAEDASVAPESARIGVPAALVEAVDPEPDVLEAYRATAERLQDFGHELVDLDADAVFPLPVRRVVAANFVILCAEAYSDHASSLRDHANGYGESARHYISQGAFLSADDYLTALAVRKELRAHFDTLFGTLTAVLLPTSPVTTTRAARDPRTHRKGGNAVFTAPFNLTGLPATSYPAGISSQGMPIGMQFVGAATSELALLQLSHAAHIAPSYPRLDGLPSGR